MDLVGLPSMETKNLLWLFYVILTLITDESNAFPSLMLDGRSLSFCCFQSLCGGRSRPPTLEVMTMIQK